MHEPQRYPSGALTYPGDATETLVRQMMGPTTYGTYMICVRAEYDPEAEITRAHFVHALPDDINHHLRDRVGIAHFPEELL